MEQHIQRPSRQNFRLIAPRIQRYTKLGDTPGNLLFDGTGDEIVRLVARPIQPQSFPSTFVIVVSASPSAQPQNGCRAVEVTAEDSPQEMQEKHLKRKANDEEHVGSPLHKKLVDAKSSVTFSDLPTELHSQIFDYMEPEDTVCLGLASRYLWAIARGYLHEHYASYLGRWAGQRIVFAGEGAVTKDYPPGLFSEDEVDELPERISIPYSYENPLRTWITTVPTTLYHFTTRLFAYKQKFVSLSEESMRLYVHCRDRNRFKYDPALKSTFRELMAEEATYFPQDQPWILRNLATKEFVRSEAIALKPEFIHGPFIDGFGFGEVIISRICWSSRPCLSMDSAVPIHRGVWAGHGFDITTLAKHRAGTTEAEWRDVSEEVANEIAIICETKYGPNWREIICNRFSVGRVAS